ncbi:hypothetical protein PIB30_081303 [Stylosanthes scabra]|uniref:Uncharacterized protein n=1 Tax=Stylosanthes scabra TaxID=79078 RepID=A0ABU6RS29_9FABA|nr:hypothetical protein [Stylosanthes scabra]
MSFFNTGRGRTSTPFKDKNIPSLPKLPQQGCRELKAIFEVLMVPKLVYQLRPTVPRLGGSSRDRHIAQSSSVTSSRARSEAMAESSCSREQTIDFLHDTAQVTLSSPPKIGILRIAAEIVGLNNAVISS